jgi:hypothetical protein
MSAAIFTSLFLPGGCPLTGDSNDQTGDESIEEAPIVVVNQPPLASAGDDQNVTAGSLVVLDGSGSNDPDFDRLSYIWRQIAGTPAVDVQNVASSRPQFTAPNVAIETAIAFRLTVADGLRTATDEVSIVIRPR